MNMIIVDVQKTASFDVDCQYTFTPECPDELPVAGGTEIVSELNSQAEFARLRLGSKEAHSPYAIWVANDKHAPLEPIEGPDVDYYWAPHAIPGTKGFKLIDGLPAVRDYDYFVWKGMELDMHPYGSCFHDVAETLSTGVIEYLRLNEINTIIVGGLATDYCVHVTTMQLVRAGFRVILNLGASRGIFPEKIAECLQEMRENGVIVVESSRELST